ncbi:UDP-2,3-diacylglucosamine diphosphatase [Vibrio fluvialis]|nr:UDP-2,3-diacylglucosamine diphosphatase [Vibrio fluvialis]EKO3443828.1 UDP-2,3-diacylglucosamine diphosphatase [Vibrio fluvialis]EKO3997115.1 UDP-2,3-diacylglucosamine diphosphatase [Vibrio fluvialis]ELF6482564.1 UDP-2,3-diacylglucosamine diphosphatase [Vibrio fluvialis]ELG4658302.1 UDP-2,3-diacylglucosamine diphosphatase [Vibrio fluvialis]
MHTLFISDLHLTPNRPDITHCFTQFMRSEATKADALYVLGDLFDFWIGDDDPTSFAEQIKQEFKHLTSNGVPCYFIHGNRDFLIGRRFAKETGVTLLDEEAVVDLYGTSAVILHGDTLCTEDVRYLAFREKVHQPWLQWIFNRLPYFIKKRIVAKIQTDIRSDKSQKAMEIMDVTPNEVVHVMDKYGVELMIHGHTHRPAIHQVNDGSQKTRIVLGDWYTQGSVLVYSNNGYSLENRRFESQL